MSWGQARLMASISRSSMVSRSIAVVISCRWTPNERDRLAAEIGVHHLAARARLPSEAQPDLAHPERRQVESEREGIVLFHWLKRQATPQGGDRHPHAHHRPATPDEDLEPAGHSQPPTQIARREQDIATADLAPDLGMVRDIQPIGLPGHPEQAPAQLVHLGRKPSHGAARSVGERNDGQAIIRRHREVCVEAGQDTVVAQDAVAVCIGPEEGEADSREPR